MDNRAGRLILMSAEDDIGKGAAGQAVQNMNLLCGFDRNRRTPPCLIYERDFPKNCVVFPFEIIDGGVTASQGLSRRCSRPAASSEPAAERLDHALISHRWASGVRSGFRRRMR